MNKPDFGFRPANAKEKCLDLYYASDVVNKELTEGFQFKDEDGLHTVFRTNMLYDRCGFGKNEIYTNLTKDLYCSDYYIEEQEVLGHPPTGFDWLRLMKNYRLIGQGEEHYVGEKVPEDQILAWHEKGAQVFFNLKTGEPTDWEALNKLIS
jgi:hypothetical protein